MAWSARQLPKLRDQTVRHLLDPSSPLRSQTGEANQAGLDLAANHLRVAGLYWATADMAALAVSAGGKLAAARWATADRPSPFGLIAFADGIGNIDAGGVEIPVDVCTWGPSPEGCTIGLWLDRRRLVAALAERGAELVVEEVPPLVPIRSLDLPVTAEPVPLADLPDGAPFPVIAALAASWLLMAQPTLAERTVERPDKSLRAAYSRAGRPDPEVSIIDLRRLYVPGDRDEAPSSRRFRYRWVVSGHWRNQAYGPDRSLRRPTWIPAYVKGPDGAPLLEVERVNVWRR